MLRLGSVFHLGTIFINEKHKVSINNWHLMFFILSVMKSYFNDHVMIAALWESRFLNRYIDKIFFIQIIIYEM
ncbi:hypothetical protein DXC47_05805 [Eubacterium sp. TF05-29]|nr:hypothetical protein DW969_01365 [Eubacterium sp. AM47-9]RJV87198.1 hypothetical protein DWX13_05410 [Eubacterium sp. AF18-3]RJW11474.1 hypothetical protein DW751_00350 [Eubacterium sp. AM28-8LB]RJW20074.1 hypothetical protein DXD20_00410 [Eubacterium sp. TF12-12]RJW25503.1 hypothetical protein DXC47_05805 [Eubacterium sp. TF05-29]